MGALYKIDTAVCFGNISRPICVSFDLIQSEDPKNTIDEVKKKDGQKDLLWAQLSSKSVAIHLILEVH